MGLRTHTKQNITLVRKQVMLENAKTTSPNRVLYLITLLFICRAASLRGAEMFYDDRPLIATGQQHALVEDGTKMTSAAGTNTLTKGRKTPSLVYQGRLYFFCCQRHMRDFQADPDKYVKDVKPPNGKDISNIPVLNMMWGSSTDQPVIATNSQHALVEDRTMMTSPVSGETIFKSRRTPSAVYEDRLYFFCCQEHLRKFHANPGRYARSVVPPNGTRIKDIIERNRKRLQRIDKVLIAANQQHGLIADGTKIFCPVIGKPLTKRPGTPAALYKGKIYYFSSNAGMRKFAAAPDGYTKNVKAPNGMNVDIVAGLRSDSGRSGDHLLAATDEQHAVVENGTSLISPVSEQPITKVYRTASAAYKGRIFYFCCNVDMRKFQINPERYIPDVIPPNGISIAEGLKEARLREQWQQEAEMMVYEIEIGSSPVLGPADAAVTIVEFTDFQCPFCVREWPKIKKVLNDYIGKVRLVFKHYPLNFHAKARPAHAAAEFANLTKGVEAFWKMHDMIIANPKDLEPATLRRYAELLGLNLAEFDKLMADPSRIDELLKTDITDAADYGVSGTPTVFINGLKLDPRTAENYRSRIDEIIAENTHVESANDQMCELNE